MAKQQKRLGDILVEWGIIQPAEVQRALEHAKQKNLRLGEALVDLKLAAEANVYKALAQQHNMEYVDIDKNSIPGGALSSIPDELMRKYLILPLGTENGKLRVAIHDPLDFEMQEILRFRLGKDLRPVLAPRSRAIRLPSANSWYSALGVETIAPREFVIVTSGTVSDAASEAVAVAVL